MSPRPVAERPTTPRVGRWRIGRLTHPDPALLAGDGPTTTGHISVVDWSYLPGPAGDLADPLFAPANPGANPRLPDQLVMAERLAPWTGRGEIVAWSRGTDGSWVGPRVVITADHHLSYPFTVEVDGHLWCVPEMAEAGRVQAWVCTSYPWVWEPGPVLVEGVGLLDPTLVQRDGVWWMFGATSVDRTLVAFTALAVEGHWTPHPANPLVQDADVARPAGAFFTSNGDWYRPSQDCTDGYGGAVIINRVLQMDPGGYAEERAGQVTPDPAGPCPDGLHTISIGSDGTVLVDGLARIPPWRLSPSQLVGRLARRLRTRDRP